MVVILLIGLLAGACSFLRIRSKNDVIATIGMWRECPPVWKDLALGRIVRGDTVDRLYSLHPPLGQRNFGPFTMYSFDPPASGIQFTGLNVVARDGRLVLARAASCTWTYSFFEDEETMTAFHRAVSEALRQEENR